MLENSEEALVVQQSEQVEGTRGGSEGKEGGAWAGLAGPHGWAVGRTWVSTLRDVGALVLS